MRTRKLKIKSVKILIKRKMAYFYVFKGFIDTSKQKAQETYGIYYFVTLCILFFFFLSYLLFPRELSISSAIPIYQRIWLLPLDLTCREKGVWVRFHPQHLFSLYIICSHIIKDPSLTQTRAHPPMLSSSTNINAISIHNCIHKPK